MTAALIKLFCVLSFNHAAALVLNGCDSTQWEESYGASEIFPTSDNSTHCMIIESDWLPTEIHKPTLWFGVAQESNIYYNISFNISCNLINQKYAEDSFNVMFRVLSISIDKNDNTVEYNDNFSGYLFQANCGKDSQKLSVKTYPNSEDMDTNNKYKQFDLNNGQTYNIQIIIGDKLNKDPTYHQIYINNDRVLKFYDNTYLYGGVGIAVIQDGWNSTFFISDFIANGIGYEDNKQCEDIGKIKHINWMDMSRNRSLKPNILHTITVNQFELSLNIKLELDYIGYSYGDRLETYGYGTTYILDFESLDAHSIDSAIDRPGVCSNRLAESFWNKQFTEWWDYSLYPYLDNQIGQIDKYLAYPKPSKYWNIYMKNSECTPIVYEGTFNLNDLRECSDYNNSVKYLKFVNTDKWMNISGAFYVNMISPMTKDVDIGYYYVYQLLSFPFVMSIKKNINILSSSGISLFTLTFVAVYKEDNESKYTLILLTEAADYLFLTVNKLLDSPSPNVLQIVERENDNCLELRNNICSQLFEVYAFPIECPNNIFNGQYGIRFDIQCNPHIPELLRLDEIAKNLKLCNNWLDAEIEDIEDNTVDLFVDLQFEDTICDKSVYLIEFNANTFFYIDEKFTNLQTDVRNGYEMGSDTVFVSIVLSFNGAYDILEAHLINVWLCTVDQKYDNDTHFLIHQNGENGGCFATDIIDDNQPYFIIQNGEIGVGYNDLNPIIYERDNNLFSNSNEVRYSFDVPTDIIRNTLYIHSQITIKLISDEVNTINWAINRRILIETGNVQDQVRHFMNSIYVIPTHDNDNNNQISLFIEWINVKTISLLIIISALIAVIIVLYHKRTARSTNPRINTYVTE
eukprot:192420_1